MKVIVNALSARLGGGQTYLLNLLARLPQRSDLELVVYAPTSLSLPPDDRIHRRSVKWPTENPLLRTIWESMVLPALVARERAQILFCPGGVVATRVPANCKVVTTFQNMIPFDDAARARVTSGLQRMRNFLLRRVLLRSLANADLAIFISDHARRVIEALSPMRNTVTVPHGLSEAFRTHAATVARPARIPAGDFLLYVSRFDVYKHHREVVLAYADLPETLRGQYRLIFVGETDGPLVQPLRDMCSARGLHDRVVLWGPVPHDQLPAFYHHAAVNLFASSCENCPNILLEALGAGRPILSSNVMPMPEFGADAVSYFSPTDPASIRNALQRVLESASDRQRLGEAAARRSDDFDWARSASTTWEAILALAAG